MNRDIERARLFAEIPAWYSGPLHFACTQLVALGIVAASLWLARDARWFEWLFIPSFYVFANFFEWWVHRGPMHHRTKGLAPLFERHTLIHHVYFQPDSMPFHSHRELLYVLFPVWVVPLFLVLVSPIVAALYFLASPALALIFVASAFSYYLVYEWFHTMHHLPQDRGFGATAFAKLCRRHHTRHHDPARMTQGNFNVSFPLADWLLGTWLKP